MARNSHHQPSIIEVELKKNDSDQRKRFRIVELIVTNNTDQQVQLYNICIGGNIESEQDNTRFRQKNELKSALMSLENVINDEILFSSEDNVRKRAGLIVKHINELLGVDFETFFGFLRYCALFLYRPIIKDTIVSKFREKYQDRALTIENYEHALYVVDNFEQNYSVSEALKFIIGAKMERIKLLANDIAKSEAIPINISPGDNYAEKIVFHIPISVFFFKSL